jgi:hypothetical protein
LTEGEIQTDGMKGIYGFTEGIVDPIACQKVELAPGKFINISNHIQGELKDKFIAMLKAYEDVFAWSHEDLKGIDPKYGQHRIDLVEGAIPIRQKQYIPRNIGN